MTLLIHKNNEYLKTYFYFHLALFLTFTRILVGMYWIFLIKMD